MDERAHPTSTSSGGGRPSSPSASFFSSASAADNTVFEFLTSEVPEQWFLLDDDDLLLQDQNNQLTRGYATAAEGSYGLNGTTPPPRRRGRRPFPGSSDGPVVSHVEAERLRRDRLHRRFCDLRAAVPTVSGMDKASLLSDAISYIIELRGRVEQLESEAQNQQAAHPVAAAVADAAAAGSSNSNSNSPLEGGIEEEKLEVRMLGSSSISSDAAASLRFTTTAARHSPARLMAALRSLGLHVQHASVFRLGDVTVQDAVVDVPAGLRDEGSLRANLLLSLQESG